MASPTVFTAIQRLVHGRGVIAQLPAEIDRLHARKILIVTDPGLVKAGIAPRVTELLGGRRGDLFTEVEPDPSIETVIACAETVRREATISSSAWAAAARSTWPSAPRSWPATRATWRSTWGSTRWSAPACRRS